METDSQQAGKTAVAGALVVAVPGSARILQLRRANRNARRALTSHPVEGRHVR